MVLNRRKRKNAEEVFQTSARTENKWKKRREEVMKANSTSIPENKDPEVTKVVALDCEFVGAGSSGAKSILARVSIVNSKAECIYDKYVRPTERITDFRTEFSGIRPANLVNSEPFKKVQLEVRKLIAGRTVVGHALQNDFKVLNILHPRRLTRDTSKYMEFKKTVNKKSPSLKSLAEKILGINIQNGEHNSVCDPVTSFAFFLLQPCKRLNHVIDAQVAMRLYQIYRKKWEDDLRKF
uniref:RNA exonuclease 4 n=1 Tax=Enterobius vermicularis TaxID=51028 RepID=A0A0N4UZQ0_ENTVE